MRSLRIGATGMLAQQTNVEVISNNIANMNTTAYTRRRTEFYDLLYQNIRLPGSAGGDADTIIPTGIQIGLGVRTAAVYRITSQGPLLGTDNPLDIAIEGRGYFQIQQPNGDIAFTRDGAFQVNADGMLVTHEGDMVEPNITIPDDAVEITISSAGEIFAKIDGQAQPQNLGQLELATFVNEAGLEAIGKNLFLETEASGAAVINNPNEAGYGSLVQGFLEGSNVNAVSEITDLISAQRAYEMNSKIIQASDEMMSTMNQLK